MKDGGLYIGVHDFDGREFIVRADEIAAIWIDDHVNKEYQTQVVLKNGQTHHTRDSIDEIKKKMLIDG